MQQDTLVNVLQAASFGLILWHDISELMNVIEFVLMLNDMTEWNALMKELDKLDPNTTRGLAWQGIKAWGNEPS